MDNLDLKLALDGPDANEDTLLSLEDWIREEHISGVKKVEPEAGKAEPGKMGLDPITVLSVILASSAMLELVKSIHVWIRSTRPKVKVKVQLQENRFIEIDAENIPDLNVFLEEVLAKVQDLEADS